MNRCTLIVSCLMLFCATSVGWAKTWTSPDGYLSLDLPENAQLQSTNTHNTFTTRTWVDQKQKIVVTIVTDSRSSYRSLDIESMKQGIRKAVPTAIFLSNSKRSVGGISLDVLRFQMTVDGKLFWMHSDNWINGGYAYSANVSATSDPETDPNAKHVIQSISIKPRPAYSGTSKPLGKFDLLGQTLRGIGLDDDPMTRLSASIGLMLGPILGLYLRWRFNRRKNSSAA